LLEPLDEAFRIDRLTYQGNREWHDASTTVLSATKALFGWLEVSALALHAEDT